MSDDETNFREMYAREGRAKLVLLEQVSRLTARLAIAIDALEEYTCPGLGKCPIQRMKDGSCVQERRGCGDPARRAIDALNAQDRGDHYA